MIDTYAMSIMKDIPEPESSESIQIITSSGVVNVGPDSIDFQESTSRDIQDELRKDPPQDMMIDGNTETTG